MNALAKIVSLVPSYCEEVDEPDIGLNQQGVGAYRDKANKADRKAHRD